MNSSDAELVEKSRTQKKLIGNCYRNLEAYYSSYYFMQFQHKFESLNIKLPSDLFSCKNCDSPIKGSYFYPQKKIILCANNILDSDFEIQATKLMVYAYDDARATIDPSNNLQIACTCLRAVNLSKECYTKRSKFSLSGNFNTYNDCVRNKTYQELRRIQGLSKDDAEDCVHIVWDSCIRQFDPFNLKDFAS
jgi:hypothetical protein